MMFRAEVSYLLKSVGLTSSPSTLVATMSFVVSPHSTGEPRRGQDGKKERQS
jgi:hypothetical protein